MKYPECVALRKRLHKLMYSYTMMFYVTINSDDFRLIGTEKDHKLMVKSQDIKIYRCM